MNRRKFLKALAGIPLLFSPVWHLLKQLPRATVTKATTNLYALSFYEPDQTHLYVLGIMGDDGLVHIGENV